MPVETWVIYGSRDPRSGGWCPPFACVHWLSIDGDVQEVERWTKAESIEEARSVVPELKLRFGRTDFDAPNVIETWL